MDVIVQIPDDIASRIADGKGSCLSQCALEALAAEQYRLGNLNKPDLRRLFGFVTSHQIDGFLKAHNVYEEYTMDDLERELEGLRRLGV